MIVILSILIFSLLQFLIVFNLFSLCRYKIKRNEWKITDKRSKLIAFFHPFCNAGGGGERVLWSAIKTLHDRYPEHNIIIYSDSYGIDAKSILTKATKTFQLNLDASIHFVELRTCSLLAPHLYPVFTLLGQNLGSLIVGLEALIRCPPDVLIDTMGASFIYPIYRFLSSSKIISYTHYPIISADMLRVVANNQTTFNNHRLIANNRILTTIKLIYYRVFANLYWLAGKSAHVVMVNSSWTKNHIVKLWDCQVKVVYPPCNVTNLMQLNLRNKNPFKIISISQFRPEKNHQLQLTSLARLIDLLNEKGIKQMPMMTIIGSCRNGQDEERARQLKSKCNDLNIVDYVRFKINIDYEEMIKLIEEASIAIHTMIDEHFGISVVEFLAAGLLTLVHESGGPKMDIIEAEQNGFFANDCEEFAQKLLELITLPNDQIQKIRIRARKSIERFSQENFEAKFVETSAIIFEKLNY